MIVLRLYGQSHLSGMVCYYPAAAIPADVIDGFAEGVDGKHREGPLSLATSIFFLSWSFQYARQNDFLIFFMSVTF